MKNLTKEEEMRFISKYKENVNGCWLWTDHLDKDGYGIMFFRRKNRRAHRVAWYSENGIIGNDFYIDHTCMHRACVNPSHLRKVTPRQSTLENSNSVGAINAKKTHCVHGHLLDRKYGRQRYCSVCQAEKTKRLHKKWKENPLLEGV